MTEQKIQRLIAAGRVHEFYTSAPWLHVRAEALSLDRNECQKCKARGLYRRATLVHHVKHLRDRPDLALSLWDIHPDGIRERQLISLCDDCHAEEHPERLMHREKKQPLTEERW